MYKKICVYVFDLQYLRIAPCVRKRRQETTMPKKAPKVAQMRKLIEPAGVSDRGRSPKQSN